MLYVSPLAMLFTVGQSLFIQSLNNECLKMSSVFCLEPLKPSHNDGNCGGI